MKLHKKFWKALTLILIIGVFAMVLITAGCLKLESIDTGIDTDANELSRLDEATGIMVTRSYEFITNSPMEFSTKYVLPIEILSIVRNIEGVDSVHVLRYTLSVYIGAQFRWEDVEPMILLAIDSAHGGNQVIDVDCSG